MEMERINENTIRVLIGNEDLTERGITVLDLLGSHQQIESFFYSILEEIDTEHQFQDNDSVTFQVLPNKNGLELFISKNGFGTDEDNEDGVEILSDSDDEISDFLKRQLQQKDSRNTSIQDDDDDSDEDHVDAAIKNTDIEKTSMIIKLNSFEDMVQIARILRVENAVSNLFLFNNSYYLDVTFFADQHTPETIKDDLAIAYEYGVKTSVTTDVLNEHGKKIMDQSALELTRFYFNK
ncbi:adaptor protein [Paucilactobacillus oligofermentans DSM 15707 = LMG 22743]|uniref:Adapter protein MecA n=1 Tax=Paucilactobacillus oligofermentans DSM 15707 = LMG 22743 TaxID=1423778 RepID=A0A0R1RH79_9LACO|nr:adaptor protein MecA [Paucilactobacillus oligofermentans]KRL54580.1 adaptor protein [Paucilactobacillus oligofermentans DSM 15707 = LMG 22743]CUS26514.1 Adapter protein MecA [Paucilactobacillus oligofermentans DSM 15707 = LMG 22743]